MKRPPVPADLRPVLGRLHPHRGELLGRVLADEVTSLTDDVARDLDDPDGLSTLAIPIPDGDTDPTEYGQRLALTMLSLPLVSELLRERGYLVQTSACPAPEGMAVAWRIRLVERRAEA